MNKQILVTCFDATGTLFKVKNDVGFNYVKFDQEKVNKSFLKEFSLLSLSSPCYGKSKLEGINNTLGEGGREWWTKLIKTLLSQSLIGDNDKQKLDSIPDKVFDDLYDAFAGSLNTGSMSAHDMWELFPEVPETLQYLKDKGQILSIISNFDERLESILSHLGIIGFFNKDLITTSIDTGYQKPHHEIFKHSFDKLKLVLPNLQKSNVIYVGDSFGKDAKGSYQFGYQPVLLHRNSSKPLKKDINNSQDQLISEKTIIIKDLTEIKKLID
ncbi:hypothetical protein DLAC_08130 [Tieghemostelium lacteum]|uniref:Uncharacterized protein n=1 Tax=Tieghemostelium lacteum TaxID=361077 RepID=A0A151ZB82_TIELA|nr:hypothetical protein DLAC_08130 [Tieghemostelium lacteum]|eukprot:KYQ91207.1 hypothetical protein DLAC_08130 [Tieghemostelium lacteum]